MTERTEMTPDAAPPDRPPDRPQDRPQGPRFRLRLDYGAGQMIGPGKAELMERIHRTGSIAAAGREMGMSYKRAWQLVEVLNSMFAEELVLSSRGGAKGGGATLTATGQEVLAAYRDIEAAALEAAGPGLARLQALRDIPDGK